MKKTYMNPEMEIIKIAARQVLLEASAKISDIGATLDPLDSSFYDDL